MRVKKICLKSSWKLWLLVKNKPWRNFFVLLVISVCLFSSWKARSFSHNVPAAAFPAFLHTVSHLKTLPLFFSMWLWTPTQSAFWMERSWAYIFMPVKDFYDKDGNEAVSSFKFCFTLLFSILMFDFFLSKNTKSSSERLVN